MVPRGQLHIVELVSIHGRCADGPHLSGNHQVVQCLHSFLDRRIVIEAVDDVQVQIVGAQPLQASLNLPVDGLRGETPRVKVDLGSDDHLVPGHILLDGPAQVLLAGAFGIAVGRVEKVDAQIQGVLHNVFRLPFVQGPIVERSRFSEAHAAHTEL